MKRTSNLNHISSATSRRSKSGFFPFWSSGVPPFLFSFFSSFMRDGTVFHLFFLPLGFLITSVRIFPSTTDRLESRVVFGPVHGLSGRWEFLWSCDGKRLFHWLSLEAPSVVRFLPGNRVRCFSAQHGFWMGIGLARALDETPLVARGFCITLTLFVSKGSPGNSAKRDLS